jgi:hypothetical protein
MSAATCTSKIFAGDDAITFLAREAWMDGMEWNGKDWTGSRAFALFDVQPCFYFAFIYPFAICFLTGLFESW